MVNHDKQCDDCGMSIVDGCQCRNSPKAKHVWSEESWEGTMSSGYRHCLVCKVFKTVPSQNEECPGPQAPPAIQVIQANAPTEEVTVTAPYSVKMGTPLREPLLALEERLAEELGTPEGRRRISMQWHERMRERALRRWATPPQLIPDEELDRWERAQQLKEPSSVHFRLEYRPDRPKDRALVIVQFGHAYLLSSIGPGLDKIVSEEGAHAFYEYLSAPLPAESGVYLFDADTQRATNLAGEYCVTGEFRKVTEDEWRIWCGGGFPWDMSEWVLPT